MKTYRIIRYTSTDEVLVEAETVEEAETKAIRTGGWKKWAYQKAPVYGYGYPSDGKGKYKDHDD